MVKESARCYVKCKELDIAYKKFKEIVNESKKARERDIDREFNRIKVLCEIVEYINQINDFNAASLAYQYTLPKILEMIERINTDMYNRGNKRRKSGIYKKSDGIDIIAWATEKSELTVVEGQNGEKIEYDRINYLYTYLKERQMAIAARYFIKWNIHYLEKDKTKKSYPRRERVLESAVWWVNQMLLGRFGLRMPDYEEMFGFIPNVIIFSTFPSSGKSFLCNTANEMFSILSSIITKRGGVLRVSNEQGNIFRQSGQTISLIRHPLIFDIYPEFKKYISAAGKYDPFTKSAEEEWGIKDCEYTPNTSIFKTRDSAINSVRCELAMFDDPSRGLQESNNIQIHQKICTLYNGDFKDRFENQEDVAIILTGTMYNPFDVFSTEIQKALAEGAYKDTRFNNTYISKNKRTIVIVNDCEDEYGNSAYPEFISDKFLEEKRNSLPAYDYHCIWRQKPIPAEGLIFAKEFLRFYNKLPTEISKYSFAVLDSTRRTAKDFCSMPILKRSEEDPNDFYLVDIIHRKKSVTDLYDDIVNKIYVNGIIKLYYEENIDTSLGTVLKTKLKERGIDYCELIPIYSVKNKMQKIADAADNIKKHIIFPDETIAPNKSEMGYAIYQLMQFEGDKSKNDDFPDALSMFVMNMIMYGKKTNYIKASNKLPF